MSPFSYIPSKQPGLKWAPGIFYPIPEWTREPHIDTIKSLSRQHLHLDDETEIEVSFLDDGTFNKSYTVAPADGIRTYIFRVSLPVEPFYKTESEVATLSYIRSHTLIPVPRVLAFDASFDNELGFEWILMEKVKGVSLDGLWAGLPETTKVSVVKEVAGYICQMREQYQFTAIGNLYHRKALKKAGFGDKFVRIDGDRDAVFAIGPLVSTFFFLGRRIRLPRDRGPFHSDRDYMKAHMQIEIDDMDLLLKSQHSEDTEGNIATTENEDNAAEYDDDLAENAPKIKKSCSDLLSLLPKIFPESRPPKQTPSCTPKVTNKTTALPKKGGYTHHHHRFVLHHEDFSLSNILVDPKTHRITGIVDWECVSITPCWEEHDSYPKFIMGPAVDKKPIIGDEDKEDELLVERMQDWERMQLRVVFDQTIATRVNRNLNHKNESSDDEALAKRKKEFMEHLLLVEFSTKAVNRWIADVKGVLQQEAAGGDYS